MRLGFAVFRRRGGEVFHFASEFDGFGPIPVISPRLRRILDHPGAPPRTFAPRGGGRRGISPHPGAPPTFTPPKWECWRWQVRRRPLACLLPPRSQWRWRGQVHRRGPSPSEAQARCGLPTWEPPRVCIQKCAGAGQARFPGNPAVPFPEVPPFVPPWRPSLPGVAHKGGNKETPRGTQRRNQALVCDNVLRKSGPCVRNREQRAKREPHSHDNKLVGRSARGAAHRSAEPGPGIPNRLGGGRPARGGGAVPDPGRTSRAGPQPAGRQARPMSPRPSA